MKVIQPSRVYNDRITFGRFGAGIKSERGEEVPKAQWLVNDMDKVATLSLGEVRRTLKPN